MDRQILNFTANEQILVCDNPIKISTNKVNYIEARFDLGQNWSGYDSVRAVWFNDFQCISTVLDSQGVTFVPFEVMKRKGNVKVNLVGSISENDVLTDRLTSYPVVAVVVDCIAQITGANTSPITPSEYEQFVASVRNDADRAEQGASDAGTYANNAQGYAQNASESATSAENYASDAEDARDEIRNMSANATTLPAGSSATASYSDGVLSLGIPQGIQGEKGDNGDTGATPNLTIGTVETLEPTESATATITGTDENPVLNLGLPKGEQGEVSLDELSALLPTDTASGSIASFSDGTDLFPALSVKAQIEPIQDLHGYDKPWAGGAGTNMIDADNPLTFTTTKAISFATPIPSGTMVYAYSSSHTYATEPSSGSKVIAMRFEDANNQVVGITYANSTGIDRVTLTGDAVRVLLYSNGYNYTDSVDVTVTVKDLMLSKSAITSYSPYTNICPISGHTECVTSVSGVNVWDEEWEFGSLNAQGQPTANQWRLRSKNYIPIMPNTAYYACFEGVYTTGTWFSIWYYDVNKNYISGYAPNKNSAFTTPSNARYMKFNTSDSWNGATYTKGISINYPSTDHDYHAYQGDTYTTALGRTVYGGTLDVVSGGLVVDKAIVDLESLNWTYNTTYACWQTSGLASLVKRYTSQTDMVNNIAEKYVVDPNGVLNGANFTDGKYILGTSGNLFLKNGSNVTKPSGLFVYELATPQTYQLDPTEVDLLLGQNNLWTDCGSVEVTYKADIQRWVLKKLSE